MFVARISRGRTIREFVLGVLLIPAGFTFFWLSIFGNSALLIELSERGGEITSAVTTELPTALFVFLEHLPQKSLASLLAMVLIVTFFVTSSDSGSLVIDIITSGGKEDPPKWQRIFWAVSEGVIASVLLVAAAHCKPPPSAAHCRLQLLCCSCATGSIRGCSAKKTPGVKGRDRNDSAYPNADENTQKFAICRRQERTYPDGGHDVQFDSLGPTIAIILSMTA